MSYEISVIIPNYNNSIYLEQCIESIISQDFYPKEIIIVDDCSTDKSVEIIKRYETKYDFIKGIYLKENKGVSYARHVGIISSKYKYITTTDSDDYYICNKKLSNEINLIKYYKETYNQDIVSYSKTIVVEKNGDIIDKYNDNYYYHEGKITNNLFTGFKQQFFPRDYCFSREMYMKSGGYDFDMNLYEDVDLLIRLSKSYKFYSTKKEGIAHRINTNGLSSRKPIEHITAKKNVYKKNEKMVSIPKKIIYKFCRIIITNRAKIKQIWGNN